MSSKMKALVQEKKAGYVRIELGVQEGTRQIVASVSHINAYHYWKIGENKIRGNFPPTKCRQVPYPNISPIYAQSKKEL